MDTIDAARGDEPPPSGEFSAIWVAYVLHATGPVGFVFGPLVGLIVNYVKRDSGEAGFIGSHHRWLIRTFWWTLAAYIVCIGVIIAGVWPFISAALADVIRTGGTAPPTFSLTVTWDAIFATVGAATVGGLGIVVVWIWNIYRLVRGGLLLAEEQPAP